MTALGCGSGTRSIQAVKEENVMRIGRRGTLALSVGLSAMALTACGSSGKSDSGNKSAGSGASGKKLAWISENTKNDKSFGQASFTGAQKAANQFNLSFTAVDGLMNKPQQAENAILNAARDADLIVDGATTTYNVLPRIAQQHPDVQFGVDSIPIKGTRDNLHYAVQDWYPLGYQSGVAAASASKSGVIGFIGGGEIPPTIAGRKGFEAGAKSVNPKIKVVGTITGDFNDASKGSNAAQAQIAQKADVLFSFLDAGHEGVVKAAKSAGNVKVMGVVVPKCSISSGVDIGDAIASEDTLVFRLVQTMASGHPKNLIFGIQDPKVAGFKYCPGHANPSVQQKLDQVREKFTSGQLKSPAGG